MPTPEAFARKTIDQKLTAAGWIVQDFKALNLGAGPGVAVRECFYFPYVIIPTPWGNDSQRSKAQLYV